MLFLGLLALTACNDELAQPPVVLPEGGIGSGAWNNPMTAYQASLGATNDTLASVWVKGYIVGYINTASSNTLSAATATFTVPATVKTNLLIAGNPNEKDWQKCVTVQLPSGAVRNALNLGDVPANLGKLVCIKGTTGDKYCGAYGVRSVSAYNFGEVGVEDGSDKPQPPTPPVVTGDIIYQGLAATDTVINWTYDNVTLTDGLTYIWKWKAYNNAYYLNASGYLNSAGHDAESYAISPVIDLTNYKSATFEFDHAAKFQTTIKELCWPVIREEGKTEWIKLTILEWPGTTSWTFVSSGAMDISAFAGKKVQIGFRYGSSTAGADTWEIKNVKVTGVKK